MIVRLHGLWPFLSRAVAIATLALLGTASTAALAVDTAAPVVIIDANDFVADHSQVGWSEAYLQWIASFPHGSSPVSDTTGAQCAAKQDGDVWFLAMSDGTAPFERTCAVPAGKTLFVPVAATLERSGNKEPDCPSMARIAADTLTHHASRLSMTIDGQAVDNLESHRAATGDCFALGLRQVPRVAARTAVADGYYVMLKPLAAGPHTLVVGARFDSVSVSTTYRLDVR
jgi:hypothetical protein